MTFEQCHIEGVVIVRPRIFEDSRGVFFESYNKEVFHKNGITAEFVQDNQSQSGYGVIRGLHFQREPYAQGKLVRVLEGNILDVVVDLRKSSATCGEVFSVELSAENNMQLWIPAGFAHGFSVLSPTATVVYKCDHFYNKESEGGIRYNDAELAIDWKIAAEDAIVSEKDLQLPSFRDCRGNFE